MLATHQRPEFPLLIKMNIYRNVTAFFSPFIRGYVCVFRRYIYKKEDAILSRFQERLGIYIKRDVMTKPQPGIKSPSIWIHAASIGESMTALDLVNALRQRAESNTLGVLLTVGTVNAKKTVEKKYIAQQQDREVDTVSTKGDPRLKFECIYAPIDVPRTVTSFFEHYSPACGIFIESELWPNLICEASKRNIPLALLNARLSEKSYSRWNKFKFSQRLFQETVGNFNTIQCQTVKDAARYTRLGANPNRTKVFGNMKIMSGYDRNHQSKSCPKRNEEAPLLQERQTLENILCQYKREEILVIVGGSTYEEDETLLLDLHQLLIRKMEKKTSKRILSIIAPRKTDHVGSLKRHIKKRGLKTLEWSSIHMGISNSDNTSKHVHEDPDVLLIDTVGILCLLYENADCIYVGGGLTPESVGGHNFMEALSAKYNSSRPMTVFTGSCLSPNMEAMIEVLEKHGCEVPNQVSEDGKCGAHEIYRILESRLSKNEESSGKFKATKASVENVQDELIENILADLKLSKVLP